MKYVIDDKLYDTETAESVCHLWHVTGWVNQRTLYKTKKGTWFLVHINHFMAGFEKVQVKSELEVKEILADERRVDLHEKHFGEIEEG